MGGKLFVTTDNNPLVHFKTAKVGAIEQRWAAELAQFDFDIVYQPGKVNPADALSRHPVNGNDEIPDNSRSTLVPSHIACIHDISANRNRFTPPVVLRVICTNNRHKRCHVCSMKMLTSKSYSSRDYGDRHQRINQPQ